MRTKITVSLSAPSQSATRTWEGFESLKEVLDSLPRLIEKNREYFDIASSRGFKLSVEVRGVEECNDCPAHMCRSPHSGERCKCTIMHKDIPRTVQEFPKWCPLKAKEEGEELLA
jgi:hypothetical protein